MEALNQLKSRHSKERKDLQSRITAKKKNANKKTRKGVNNECAQLEIQLKEHQDQELAFLIGEPSEATLDDVSESDPEAVQPPTEDNTNGLGQKLDATPISQTEPENQESGGPKKKRNRHKERLARRAAEQETAAIAAEEEAANMVDHKKIEKAYMLKEFKANSLVEQDIRPDGHCLFSAVADQLQQRGIPLNSDATATRQGVLPYKAVRHVAASYMEKHSDDFAPFLEEPLDQYIKKIRDTAEWGGQLELQALARAYKVEISVVQESHTHLIEPGTGGDTASKPDRIWLAYYLHGYGLGEHYNSLRKQP
ncbi:hypothetical protein MKZ38_004003 [Zalerion maritima]|uniref:OTU domain-containing protein n=1 Tax=Zalerion maritima TaxID=339359 RepID=A0AAD5WRZ5_9PEZI|nr:hypothetical protein MKZ38_004003 [Zalerion maritima]